MRGSPPKPTMPTDEKHNHERDVEEEEEDVGASTVPVHDVIAGGGLVHGAGSIRGGRGSVRQSPGRDTAGGFDLKKISGLKREEGCASPSGDAG